jgi:hypothetical protein
VLASRGGSRASGDRQGAITRPEPPAAHWRSDSRHGKPARGRVVRDAERLVVTEIFDFRATPRLRVLLPLDAGTTYGRSHAP